MIHSWLWIKNSLKDKIKVIVGGGGKKKCVVDIQKPTRYNEGKGAFSLTNEIQLYVTKKKKKRFGEEVERSWPYI